MALGLRIFLAGAAATSVLSPCASAGAQPPTDATTRPATAMPRVVSDPGVAYPAQALESGFYEPVDVELILELDATGGVVGATVVTARGKGFDEAALDAAAKLRFEPALRDGVPTASRIRYRYRFEPPPPTLIGRVVDERGAPIPDARVRVLDADGATHLAVTAPDGSWTVSAMPRGAARIRFESASHVARTTNVSLTPGKETRIVIELERRPAAATSAPVETAAIDVTVRGERRAPGVLSYTRDEVRRIPGAFGDPFRVIEGLPGVTPLASGLPFFYVRGAPPGNVGHFVDGVRVPYLYHVGVGPSVVQPALVQEVELHPGAYPAHLGRFTGGIVSATATEPRPDLHGEGSVRLFDAGAVVETGLARGRGTALVGGRYSYTAALLSLAAPELELDYRDFQGRLSYDVTPRDRVSVFSFGAYDLFKDQDSTFFASEFYRADLRHDRLLDNGKIRTAVTLGFDRTSAELLVPEDPRLVVERSVAARTELRQEISSDVLLGAGASAGIAVFTADGGRYIDPDFPGVKQFDRVFPLPRTDHETGMWVEVVHEVTPRLELTPGLRVDLYGSGSATALGIDPRLAMRVRVTEQARLLARAGIAHQPPSFLVPLAGVRPALGAGLQRSIQTSTGAEIDVAEATTAGATVFYNLFFNTTDALGAAGGEDVDANLDLRSDGTALGSELFLRRRLTKRLGGFASYTLSQSRRRIANQVFVSAFDRTHVATAAVSYDLGRGWIAGTRVLYYTGTPVWPESGSLRATHVQREPSFFRLDLRFEKRWRLGEAAWISFVAEFFNATLNKETWPGGERVGPISIPSIGAEIGF